MDQTTLNLLNQLHPLLRNTAIACYNKAVHATPTGVHPVIDQTLRSIADSEADYLKGRNAAGVITNASKIVTWALPGHSWHNYGLALDFHLKIDGKDYWPKDKAAALANPYRMTVVKIFSAAGFNSGIYFPAGEFDGPHLECKMGTTIATLLMKHNAGDFIPGTTYVNF